MATLCSSKSEKQTRALAPSLLSGYTNRTAFISARPSCLARAKLGGVRGAGVLPMDLQRPRLVAEAYTIHFSAQSEPSIVTETIQPPNVAHTKSSRKTESRMGRVSPCLVARRGEGSAGGQSRNVFGGGGANPTPCGYAGQRVHQGRRDGDCRPGHVAALGGGWAWQMHDFPDALVRWPYQSQTLWGQVAVSTRIVTDTSHGTTQFKKRGFT